MKSLEFKEQIDKLIEDNLIVLIQFSSLSCTPCISIEKKIDEWLRHNVGIIARHIMIEDYPDLAAQHGVLSFPTILVYIEGKEVIHESGYFSVEEVLSKLSRYLELLG